MPADVLSVILARRGALAVPAVPRDLLAALSGLRDPRRARGVRHRVAAIVAVTVCAVAAGAQSLVAIGEWAAEVPLGMRHRLGLGRRVPSETTIRRVLQRLDPDELDALFCRWLTPEPHVPAEGPRVVAIDGKTVRGARTDDGQVHLLAAFDTGTGAALGQVRVEAKHNEITAFPLLVRGIGITGALVTADAMHTQRGHVTALRKAGAHWLFTVKDNQPTLRKQLSALPWKDVPVTDRTLDAEHGRVETRTLQVAEIRRGIGFPGAKLAIRVRRTRRIKGRTESETTLAITDLTWHQITPHQLAHALRAHWGIENRLHWVRDVTFGEDQSQVRTGNAPAVMAGVRNLVIGLHRRHGADNMAEACRRVSRDPARALELIE